MTTRVAIMSQGSRNLSHSPQEKADSSICAAQDAAKKKARASERKRKRAERKKRLEGERNDHP